MLLFPLYAHLFPVVLVGDDGRPELMTYFRGGPKVISNIGVDFAIKTVEVDEKKMRLQLWETGLCLPFLIHARNCVVPTVKPSPVVMATCAMQTS